MNRNNVQIKSEFLRGGLCAALLLPATQEPRRLLTLLHGAGETPEILLERFDFSPWVERCGLAVLLPELGNSFCLDWGEGEAVRTALLRELLPTVQARFRLDNAREKNAVGGISMGGFGALSLALSERERFCAAFSLSGALDLRKAARIVRICGIPSPGDLAAAARRREADLDARLEDPGVRSALYLAWGDGDWFRDANRSFSRKAEARGFQIRAEESPGMHHWDYWKTALGPALDWAAGI